LFSLVKSKKGILKVEVLEELQITNVHLARKNIKQNANQYLHDGKQSMLINERKEESAIA
jgi:hypothetical protein